MTAVRNYLAVDLGAESGRAILGEFDGARIRLSALHRFPNGPVRLPDGIHWDVLRLWSEIKEGISIATRKHGKVLAGAGLDTWGVDFGLLDRQGSLIGNPYHYRDSRTEGILAEAFRRLPAEEIFAATGIQFMSINSLYQLLSMVIRQAPALDVAQTFLTIPDLFNYWMTGRKTCEFSIATTTQCYNPVQRGWATPVIQAMGIPGHLFGEIVPPGTRLGTLLPEIAEEVGAPGLSVIAPACHDTGSAVAAVPAKGKHFPWISCGTWSIMGVEVDEPVISSLSLQHNFTNEGGAGETFRFCKNIMGLWIVQECRRAWAARGEEHSYAELAELAAQAEPLRSIVDPDDELFLRPGDMPARLQTYCQNTSQPVPESKGAMVRCVLESIALKYRHVLSCLEEILGHLPGPLHMVGGGTQNTLLCRLTADATGRPVVAGPIEATATGNILVQAITQGDLASLAEARQVVSESFDLITYEPHPAAGWDEAYARLRGLVMKEQ